MNASNQNSRLTKAGAIILISTIVFSILFIVLGTVNLISEGDNSSNGNNNNVSKTFWAYEGTTTNYYVTSGNYYEIKITPSRTATYTINIDGARVVSISNSYGSISYNPSYSSYYDNSYTAYLSPSYTYTIKVQATDSYINFLADY